MEALVRTQPARSLTEHAYEALRADILSCRLRPGLRLKIAELCERLGVSLGAVREALAKLTAEGLVIAEAQRGFRVAPVSSADLTDITRTRIDIESMCLARAIAVGGIEWEAGIVAAFHRLSRTPLLTPGPPPRVSGEFSSVHSDFHAALVAVCDSAWLLRIREMLYAQSEHYRRLSVPAAEQERNLDQEHRGLMQAVLAHDAKLAAELIRNHLETTAGLLKVFADIDGEG